MNSTLVGLSISIPCVLVYAWLRARVDIALQEIDRYAIAILKILNPPSVKDKSLATIGRKREEEEPADTDVTPMLNLMVLLIPFLLTQSEFVKIGAIEMKLPEASQGAGGGGENQQQLAKLDLGIVITSKGFNLFSYFKTDNGAPQQAPAGTATQVPDIGLKNKDYDYAELNKRLADIKKKVLVEILKPYNTAVSVDLPISTLYSSFLKLPPGSVTNFADNDAIKIVAEEKIKYATVIAVMDAARGARTDQGNVTMFPNVSIAGGIVQ
jgi:biopolymer transport protein ExbD